MATQFIALFADKSAQNSILATGATANEAISTALINIGGDLKADDLIAQPVTSRLGARLDAGADMKSWKVVDGKADIPEKTEITDRDVEWSLDEAGYYDIYVLRNNETGEIDIESMQRGCYTNWGSDWTVLVCVRAHEVSRAANSRNPKASMRRLLEGRGY